MVCAGIGAPSRCPLLLEALVDASYVLLWEHGACIPLFQIRPTAATAITAIPSGAFIHALSTQVDVVQGAVHAVIMQNRVRHLEEKVHNGEVPARETLLSDPGTMERMKEAARYARTCRIPLSCQHMQCEAALSEQVYNLNCSHAWSAMTE